MRVPPSGRVPALTRYAGYLFLAYAAYGLVYILSELANPSTNDLLGFWVGIPFLLLYTGFLYVIGRLLVSAFPNVVLAEGGIRFDYLVVFRGTVRWDEIIEVKRTQLPNSLAIVIRRPGHSIITPRGLFFQKWHGYIVTRAHPVVLIRPKPGLYDDVLAELSTHVALNQA